MTQNVIDTLVVKIALDDQEYTKGEREARRAFEKTKDAAKKAGDEIEGSGKASAESIKGLTREVMTLFSVFTAGRGVKEFVADVTHADTALGKMAYTLKTTPETLSTWGRAVEQLGGSGDAAARSFQGFSNSIQELRTTGNTGMLPWLYKLQAAGGQTINLGKSLNGIFIDLSKNLHAVGRRDPAMAAYLGTQLGLDADTVQLLMKGPAAVRAALDSASRNAVTKRDTDAAQALTKSWRELMQTSERLGRDITTELSPSMQMVIKEALDWTEANRGWIKSDIVGGIKTLNDMLVKTVKYIKEAIDNVNEFGRATGLTAILNWFMHGGKSTGPYSIDGLTAPTPEERADPKKKPWWKKTFRELWPNVFGPKSGADAPPYSGLDESVRSGGAPRPPAVAPVPSGRVRSGNRALRANQQEAYDAARAEGLTDMAARSLVANMSGESLKNPRDHHWDVSHMSQGIVQWDPQRAEAIRRQFGKYPKDMSVAEQTRAAIWEIRSNPRFARTRDALENGTNSGHMIDALVRNYEVPANKERAISERMAFMRGLDVHERAAGGGIVGSAQASERARPSPFGGLDTGGRYGFGAGFAAESAGRPITRNNSATTNVGTVTINTMATDASGIARDMSDALHENSMASMANTGAD